MDLRVAYFCMEFGLHEEFPIYAGGLGILAGDFIKSAHDLKLPVIGVGLRWATGPPMAQQPWLVRCRRVTTEI